MPPSPPPPASSSRIKGLGQQQQPVGKERGAAAAGTIPFPALGPAAPTPAAPSKEQQQQQPEEQQPAAPSLEDCQRCCDVLRVAIVDPGSRAAACVPLRPSLQRIQADLEQV